MTRIKFLNSRDAKVIVKKLNEQFDADFKFEDFVAKSTKDKFYIISRDLEKIDFKKYNIEQYGMYFCHENFKNKEIRLSIEGAQIIGPKAKKNVVDIDKGITKLWIAGQDIPYPGKEEGIVIVRSGDDYIGCGKVKEGKILNLVPKSRRIQAI